MGLVKRAFLGLAKAALPRPVSKAIDDINVGNQHVRYIRNAVTVKAVNDLAVQRAGQVEDAMFVGKVVGAWRKHHQRKRPGGRR